MPDSFAQGSHSRYSSMNLKQLLDQAMPGAEADTRTQLVLHQFITGLPAHVSKQLHTTGEVSDLDKVLDRAELLLMRSRKYWQRLKRKRGLPKLKL